MILAVALKLFYQNKNKADGLVLPTDYIKLFLV
jgi:hypothetical protein